MKRPSLSALHHCRRFSARCGVVYKTWRHSLLPMPQVNFTTTIQTFDTFTSEEYDRSPLQVAKLRYQDMYELLQYRIEMRRQYGLQQEHSEDGCSSSSNE